MKRKIIRNLRMLESQGVVTIKNDYQDIINAIAKVIYLNLFGWTFLLHFVAFFFRVVTQKCCVTTQVTTVQVVLVLSRSSSLCWSLFVDAQTSTYVVVHGFFCVSSFSLTYRIWNFCRTSETREGTVKDGDKKRRNWGRLWKACRINRSSMKNKSTTTINTSECV